MARNPKQDANLKAIKKGELSSEEAKKRGSAGGKKSAEVRRAKRDARQSARYILNLAAKGETLEQLKRIGADSGDGLTNMDLLTARLFVSATSGNLDAAKQLLQIAGYDSEENRKERESISSDRRREIELEAKIKALGDNPDSRVSMSFGDEGASGGVVIYLPEMDKEEDCEVNEPDEEVETNTETT